MNQLVAKSNGADIMEQVIINGDLSSLKPEERVRYYNAVCQSVGLNPLTKPFEYLKLNGKLTLYALRACTDQLRKVHGVSVEIADRSKIEDVYVVTARAKDRDGRTDESTGAVVVGNLKGEALANAYMKCETKAKRRVTLSICGLGLLDESEVETVPGAQPVRDVTPRREPAKPAAIEPPMHPETGEFSPHAITVPLQADGENPDWMAWGAKIAAAVKSCRTLTELLAWQSENMPAFNNCKADAPKIHKRLADLIGARAKDFPPSEATSDSPDDVTVEP